MERILLERKLRKWVYDNTDTDVDKYDELCCGVCNGNMVVKRNVKGVRGWAAAVVGHGKDHDEWACPLRYLDWHKQAKKLKQEINKTASAKLTHIMREELAGILLNKQVTK